MKTTEKYICNGSTFTSYENAVEYCAQNNYRITNTKTLKMGVYLLTVTSITPQNHLYTTTEITRIISLKTKYIMRTIETSTEILNKLSGHTVVHVYEYIESTLVKTPKGYAFIESYEKTQDTENPMMVTEVFTVNVFSPPQNSSPVTFEVRVYRGESWGCSNTSHKTITPREYLVTGFESGEMFSLTVTEADLKRAEGDEGRSAEFLYSMLEEQETLNEMVIGNTRTVPVARDGDIGTAIVYRNK